MSFPQALETVRLKCEIPYSFKDKQIEALSDICNKKNIFCLLPTGYGKTDILVLPPLIMDEMHPQGRDKHIGLIIVPLKTLMKEHVLRCKRYKISAVALMTEEEMTSAQIDGIQSGSYSVVFVTPEAVILKKWMETWLKFKSRICVIGLDEVHCVMNWGQSFRPTYSLVSQLVGNLCFVPLCMATATATKGMVKDIEKHMDKEDECKTISVLTDRPTIHLTVHNGTAKPKKSLAWLVEDLTKKGTDCPKTLIFARSIDNCFDVYGLFYKRLGPSLWLSEDEDDTLVEVFHAKRNAEAHLRIPDLFRQIDSNLRVVISTVAFGMGMDIPDICQVIHWGPPDDLLMYWQEIGRCARDGRPGNAIMYLPPFSCARQGIHDTMKAFVKDERCLRRQVLEYLFVEGMNQGDIDQACQNQRCCSICDTNQIIDGLEKM